MRGLRRQVPFFRVGLLYVWMLKAPQWGEKLRTEATCEWVWGWRGCEQSVDWHGTWAGAILET